MVTESTHWTIESWSQTLQLLGLWEMLLSRPPSPQQFGHDWLGWLVLYNTTYFSPPSFPGYRRHTQCFLRAAERASVVLEQPYIWKFLHRTTPGSFDVTWEHYFMILPLRIHSLFGKDLILTSLPFDLNSHIIKLHFPIFKFMSTKKITSTGTASSHQTQVGLRLLSDYSPIFLNLLVSAMFIP